MGKFGNEMSGQEIKKMLADQAIKQKGNKF